MYVSIYKCDKHCPERCVGCHGKCERYAKYIEQNELLKSMKKEEAEKRNITFESMFAIKKRKRL